MRKILSALALICLCFISEAKLKPSGIFCDDMVLQQNTEAPIWGRTRFRIPQCR